MLYLSLLRAYLLYFFGEDERLCHRLILLNNQDLSLRQVLDREELIASNSFNEHGSNVF